jgi:hypothetical protein
VAKIVTTGWTDLAKVLASMPAELEAANRRAANKSATLIEGKAKRNFIGSHARGMPHVGGNRPNVVTGMARRSIKTIPAVPAGAGSWMARVGPTVIYGRRLELGYPGGAGRGRQKTRPFPYLRPAVEESVWQIRVIALSEWAKVFE